MKFLLLSLGTLFLCFSAKAATLEGVAKNSKGEIIYLEKHRIDKSESGLTKFISVEYFKPDGSKFASMTSDFSNSKTIPNTLFEDGRFKTKSTMRITGSIIEFEETRNGKTTSSKKIPLKDSMVASQGFDNFVRMNFSQLESGPVEFQFGVLDSQDFYSLTGYKKAAATSDVIEYGIKTSSWLLSFFTQELKLIYDSKTLQLKSFSGRSNILDDKGKAQEVSISYQWKEGS